ncbi:MULTISPECIES: hypothetical protein [unclassified Caulobacter]|uniref:hypothetical protein n=1 Tax=unclassified Caulobacter TaxID=2648921 RepID=UPI0006F36D0F|nr:MULTISPECIES: hypothetical protein [unclassified Caulobacter]KQV62248.1 hypothetical protein ASC62_01535 [Caulobacter sp. Root342]KQV63168.1 hypothetical protein ASC70_22450 [Caulobacter sp. Root343]
MESLLQYELLVPFVGYLFALVICGVAFRKGDLPLRLAALVLIIGWAITPLVSLGGKVRLNYPVTIIDTNCALIFVWISMRWRRLWCAMLAALTIVIVIIPIVYVVDPQIHKYTRFAANNVVTCLQLVVLWVAIGLTVRARRRADEGAVRS